MRKLSKILALVLVLMTVLMSISVLTVNAVAGQTWTVAGVKALCGTDWDTANTANDMTYDADTDSYVKVYTNVKAGTYQFKCAKDHKWNTAYPGSNYNLKVEKDGSTVTITLKGTTVTAKVEAPACDHKYEVTAATVTCLTGGSRTWTCSVCGDSYTEEKLDALGHYYDESGKCIRCDATTEFVRVYVDNVAKWSEVYCYTWDTNPYVAWPGEKLTLTTEDGLFYYDIPKNFVNVIFNNGGSTQSADLKTPTGTATIYNNSTKVWSAPHVHEFVDGKCECGEEDPNYVPHEHVWSEATCTEPQKCECGETQGEALGHTWVDASCAAPKTCSTCGATEGEALPHTPGAEATCTAAQTCTVCGTELAPMLEHVDANLDITCDYAGCTKRILPPADSKVSLFTANHMIIVSLSNNYYVEGVVTEVVDAKNGNFIITDEAGDQLFIRMPVDANGVSHANWEMKVVVGDVVSIYGKPKGTSGWNTTLKAGIQGGVLTYIDQHDHVAKSEPVCSKDTLCACGAVVAPATGHIDADANGICDNCPWDMNLVEVNIAIGTDSKYNGVRVDDEAGKALSWTWSADGFDAIFTKGTSTVTLYTTAKDYMQLKKQNVLTVANNNDVTVKYVVISVTTLNYLNTLKTAIGSQYEFTANETDFTVTIQLNSTEDFVLVNQSTSTIYVNGVSLVYVKKGAHVHDFKETITTPATCTEAGLKTFACECGEGTYTEVIEALGHAWVEATCETAKTCSNCGATEGEALGHAWVEANCEDAKTCSNCGATEGEALGHKFIDGVCTVCSANYVSAEAGWVLTTELKDGDLVLIGNPAYGKLLSAEKVSAGSYYNKGVNYSANDFANVTDAEIFVVKVNSDGTYTFTSLTGDVISLASSFSSLNVTGEHKSWALVDKGDGTFLVKNTGRNTYLEWYSSKNNWSTYTAGNTTEYYLSFYVKADSEHVHNHITSVVAPTCTEAGKTVYTCSCGDAYEVAGDAALGHTEEVVAGKDATCIEAGLTEGKKCSVCGEVTVAQEEVPALGHDFANGSCTRCEAEDPDYVPEHPSVDDPTEDPKDEPTTEEPDGFAKIWQSIVKVVMMIVEFFKGLFVKA